MKVILFEVMTFFFFFAFVGSQVDIGTRFPWVLLLQQGASLDRGRGPHARLLAQHLGVSNHCP